MKKRWIRTLPVLSLMFIVPIINSCSLGGSYTIENRSDFVYITRVSDTKCAATSNGYVTSSLISSLQYGDCYLMGYTLSNNRDANGFFVAEESALVNDAPLRRFAVYDKNTMIEDPGYNVYEIDDFGVFGFDPYLYYGDNWHFKVVSKYNFENTDVRIRLAYDRNNQFDKTGSDVSGTNRVILDMIFEAKEGTSPISSSKLYDVAVNMNNLRMMYTPNFSGAIVSGNLEYVNVLVQLRYKHNGKDEYLGNWDGLDSSFYLSFVKE